jgi:hypothetical protein
MEIDFTSKDFKFVSKPDEYFVEGTQVDCEDDFSQWKEGDNLDKGYGLFRGLTTVPYKGYTGELPRMDGDTSSFAEFDIYWKDHKVDHMTYGELKSFITSETLDEKINLFINQNSQKVKEKIEYTFQIGDIVKSKWNNYGKEDPYQIDRLYERKDGQSMARLISGSRRINIPLHSLEYHQSHFRNDKLDQLGL